MVRILAPILSSQLSSGKLFFFPLFINHNTPLPECRCDLRNSVSFSACTYDSHTLVCNYSLRINHSNLVLVGKIIYEQLSCSFEHYLSVKGCMSSKIQPSILSSQGLPASNPPSVLLHETRLPWTPSFSWSWYTFHRQFSHQVMMSVEIRGCVLSFLISLS